MPTFGRETIRRFSNNTSEMKKLAARDFEDLLQVHISTYDYDNRLMRFSVLFQSSMVFCQSRITMLFCGYYSSVVTGMVWQNFVCIQMTRSRFSTTRHAQSVLSFVNLATKRVLHSIRENSSARRKHASVVNSRREEQIAQRQFPLDLAPNSLTCKHTNCTV